MKFKEKYMRRELFDSHTLLIQIAQDFELLSYQIAGVEPVVTRVADPVVGESGIHTMRMAFDARYTQEGNNPIYEEGDAVKIMDQINAKYERADGRKTVILHGDPVHFHFQVSPRPKDYKITKGENNV